MTALRAAKPPATGAPGSDAPPLRICRSIAALRQQLRDARQAGRTIGFVPTMGALHRGHLSLVEAASRRCELVVVSVFVNPTQFEDRRDLEGYPRDEARDAALAAQAGAHLLFAPSPEEIYGPRFATTVEVHGLTDRLEGAARGGGHFRGVTTVVCKLLNIVAPHVAFFGEKDAQQAAVIRRMVADLHIDVEIETLPTVREPDGLAMSSRNARLSPAERRRALALHAALCAAEQLAAAGERSAPRLIAAAQQTLAAHAVQPDYVALVDRRSFEDLDAVGDDALMLLAARIGKTRLIDNAVLRLAAAGDGPPLAPADRALERRPQKDQPRQGEMIAACSA